MAKEFPRPETVMDPVQVSLADMYAQALLGLAPQDDQAEEVCQDLQSVVDLLDRVDGFEDLLVLSPLSPPARRELVGRIFRDRCRGDVEGFLAVLASHGRMEVLRLACHRFRDLLDIREGKVEVELTSAAELTDPQTRQVVDSIAQALGSQVVLRTAVDPGLLGGVKIRIGDRLYDASVAGRLQQLRSRLSKRIAEAT